MRGNNVPTAGNDTPAVAGRYRDADGVSRDEARGRLARFLYETMENLDPIDGRSWGDLSENERAYFHDVVLALADVKELVRAGLE